MKIILQIILGAYITLSFALIANPALLDKYDVQFIKDLIDKAAQYNVDIVFLNLVLVFIITCIDFYIEGYESGKEKKDSEIP